MPEVSDLATPIDAPLQWPARAEPIEPTHRKIDAVLSNLRGNKGMVQNHPGTFRWMENDPHEPIQREELQSMGWQPEIPASHTPARNHRRSYSTTQRSERPPGAPWGNQWS